MDKLRSIRLASRAELDLVKTFECGQCFRWNADESGVYSGVAFGRAAKLWTRGEDVFIETTDGELADIWSSYFDLALDYEKIRTSFDCGEYFARCAEFGRGIRILAQDRWEALCSFIISQCNNIPRIKKIVETLCALYGEAIEYDGRTFYSFPSARTVAALSEADLAPLRCGYRAKYILSAARAVAGGQVDLDALARADSDSAMKALLAMEGVGKKVASCALLFGLGHKEAFPIDVWMKRALTENFPKDFDPAVFGGYAGIAQQYIFYYARSGGEEREQGRG